MLELSENDLKEATTRIAQQLNETKIVLIRRIIQLRGLAYAEDLLAQTQQIEAAGGMLVKDGKRRRTPGGVFLALAKQTLTAEEHDQVFPNLTTVEKHRIGAPQFPAFTWDEWDAMRQKTLAQRGKASEVIVQITGRIGHVERRKDVVVVSIEQRLDKLGSLPYGVPTIPSKLEGVVYTTFIAQWQWADIEKQLRQPDAQIIVKGYFAFDKELGEVVVFGTEARVKRAKERSPSAQAKQAKRAEAAANKTRGGERRDAREPRPQRPAEQAAHPAPHSAPQPAAVGVSSGYGAAEEHPTMHYSTPAVQQAARRLEELRTARATYERTLGETVEGFKAQMTKKLLTQTIAEIQDIEGRFPELLG